MTPTQQDQKTINSQKELIEITWLPLWVPEDLIHTWGCLHKIIQEYQATVDRPNDVSCDNLMRQGFSLQNSSAEAWRSTQGRSIRKKAIFDMQPTDPQTDIIPTGKCEVWIKDVSVFSLPPTSRTREQLPDPAIPISDKNKATLPNATRERRACAYTSVGKYFTFMCGNAKPPAFIPCTRPSYRHRCQVTTPTSNHRLKT